MNNHKSLLAFSVAIPTYNGAERLDLLLEKIQLQKGTENISWEVIIIDNNSTDNTKKIVESYQANWQCSFPLRYCFEPKQGLAFARQRAVKESQGKFVGFLDDDNCPAENWVISAYKFGAENPRIGAYSGRIQADFEVKPDEELKPIFQFLAIREHGSQAKQFEPDNLRLPPGAGLVIRKQAWDESVPDTPNLVGRVGSSFIGGEDYEILLYMHKAKWEIWYNPEMKIEHQIPHWRLEKDYLLTLAYSYGLATCHLLMINAKNWQKPLIILRTFLGNLRRIIAHTLKHKGQFNLNFAANFYLRFFLGSMISPFDFLRKQIQW